MFQERRRSKTRVSSVGEFSFEKKKSANGSPDQGNSSAKQFINPSTDKKPFRQRSALGTKLYDADGMVMELPTT